MKFVSKLTVAAMLIAAPAFFTNPASAALCAVSDVKLTIGASTYSPSSCANNVNNGNPTDETTNISTALGVSGFTYLDTSQSASGAGIGGIQFTVMAPGTNSGNWSVSWVDTNLVQLPNLPAFFDLAVGLFGGNEGSAYLLSNVLIPISPNSGTGTFDINFTNNGGQQPDLSHLTLAGKYVGTPPTSVPEPLSIAMLGAGLLGLGAIRRARKQK